MKDHHSAVVIKYKLNLSDNGEKTADQVYVYFRHISMPLTHKKWLAKR